MKNGIPVPCLADVTGIETVAIIDTNPAPPSSSLMTSPEKTQIIEALLRPKGYVTRCAATCEKAFALIAQRRSMQTPLENLVANAKLKEAANTSQVWEAGSIVLQPWRVVIVNRQKRVREGWLARPVTAAILLLRFIV